MLGFFKRVGPTWTGPNPRNNPIEWVVFFLLFLFCNRTATSNSADSASSCFSGSRSDGGGEDSGAGGDRPQATRTAAAILAGLEQAVQEPSFCKRLSSLFFCPF
ncbi:hypothetical protein AAC387_Pa01g3887 [Persea americana]